MKANQTNVKAFIPLDKSWIIRMGVLDLVNGYKDIEDFLEEQKELNSDLEALLGAVRSWNTNKPVDVGESGTLYRLLQFASWKLKLNKKFTLQGTLRNRKITANPSIIGLSLKKLLELDNRTSQWATASVLLGNKERILNPPYKLRLTYEAVRHWQALRKKKRTWLPRHDETIQRQAIVFSQIINGKKMKFVPYQAEDYCFARVFGLITKAAGRKKWPSLMGHESNRIVEMEAVMTRLKKGLPILSLDHRVVQAAAMWALVNKKKIKFKYPAAVNKSWPEFWNLLNYIQTKNRSSAS